MTGDLNRSHFARADQDGRAIGDGGHETAGSSDEDATSGGEGSYTSSSEGSYDSDDSCAPPTSNRLLQGEQGGGLPLAHIAASLGGHHGGPDVAWWVEEFSG